MSTRATIVAACDSDRAVSAGVLGLVPDVAQIDMDSDRVADADRRGVGRHLGFPLSERRVERLTRHGSGRDDHDRDRRNSWDVIHDTRVA